MKAFGSKVFGMERGWKQDVRDEGGGGANEKPGCRMGDWRWVGREKPRSEGVGVWEKKPDNRMCIGMEGREKPGNRMCIMGGG